MKKGPSYLKALSFIIFVGLVIFFPNEAKLEDNNQCITDLSPINDISKKGNPKIESILAEVEETYFLQGIEKAKELAMERKIEIVGDLIRVVIEADPMAEGVGEEWQEEVFLISKQIEILGGKVETTYKQLIQSLVPFKSIQFLAELPHVSYIRLPFKPIPLQHIISEGVAKTGASQWQNISPYRSGAEVKVCILDGGFKGYNNLLGTELPSSVITKSFRSDGNIFYSDHGTACAEIVHDMAPEAKLWLVNFGTDVEHHNAVDWLINQGINIISYSIGWYNIGAGNGTGPICEDVNRAAKNGIIWCSAAGNEAENHWEGVFYDSDGDGWNNFYGNDEILQFWVPAYNIVSAYLSWDDWGTWNGIYYSGSNQDYDLYLYYWTGSTWIEVTKSQNWQIGWQWPVESVGGWYSSKSTYWGIGIRRYSATRNVKFDLFIKGNAIPIEYNVPEGSLLIPADSENAVAVGATDWSNDTYHSYSSQGPTNDGRIKPDFSAPSGTSGVTYGIKSFYGTSASTPHVAGAFALVLGKTPYTLDQIKIILEKRALDLGPVGKDNRFGFGRLNLSK
jgi:subtilisin family serine protease